MRLIFTSNLRFPASVAKQYNIRVKINMDVVMLETKSLRGLNNIQKYERLHQYSYLATKKSSSSSVTFKSSIT